MPHFNAPKGASFLLIASITLLALGCASTDASSRPSPQKEPPGKDLRSRLDWVIDRHLAAAAAVKALGTFQIEDYNVQDPETFWGHRSVSGGAGFSEYYLTYRNRYVILLLKDIDSVTHLCVDARIINRTSRSYELTTGRVQVDGGPIDEELIVLFNRKWPGDSSTDILAAYRADPQAGRIEEVSYKSIVIYREE